MPRMITATVLCLAYAGCAATSWRHTAPWNFPPLHEWNAPLETSWINAVDAYRSLTAPRGQVYDPVMRNYQPDLGSKLENLP